MRSRQRHNPEPSILARPHTRGSVFQNQEFLPFNNKPKPLRPQAITSRIRFADRDFLGRHHEARVRQFHHVQPAGHQAVGAGGYDGPGRAEGLEVGEQGAGAGDFGCVGAVVFGDLGFGGADVYGWG
jgi:hypothetical protein